jgi:hypothetical protein
MTHQSKIIPGFWSHKTRPIFFTLVVDDFAIKYINEVDATHLIEALKREYTITVDNEATKYIGLTIEWDYKNGKVHAYMQGYLRKAMIHFGHDKTKQNTKLTAPPQNHPIRHKNSIRRRRR